MISLPGPSGVDCPSRVHASALYRRAWHFSAKLSQIADAPLASANPPSPPNGSQGCVGPFQSARPGAAFSSPGPVKSRAHSSVEQW